jgi:superfamily II DNA or RNA helicase
MTLAPWTSKLRAWQTRAVAAACTRSGQDFLAMATPAAGKTRFALRVAHQYLSDRAAVRIVVVCPTNHLRTQWAAAAGAVGIQLDPNLTNEQPWEARDYHGCVVTYQQVCLAPAVFDRACRLRPTLVILDELHHAGDGKDWGTSLKQAFQLAVFRLALSGTPFRSDNKPIPFVTYEHGVSVSNFTYGYPEAIRDGVCRPMFFPSYEGDVQWSDNKGFHQATFFDRLNETQSRRRLKTALLRDEWLGPVIRDAHARLHGLRSSSHRDAGGLVIAMDQDHARSMQGLMQGLLGIRVPLAISDDPESSAVITAFALSRQPWLIAVRMVSEGVDIPRLRVGIFASNISTEMYFRQVVGRFVRMRHELGRPQQAWLYLPKDPTLIGYATTIEAERQHVLEDAEQAEPDVEPAGLGRQASSFVPISAHGRADELFGVQTREASQDLAHEEEPDAPLHEQKTDLRGLHRSLVGAVARKTGADHRTINAELCRQTGGPIHRATMSQLKKRLWLLEAWKDAGGIG